MSSISTKDAAAAAQAAIHSTGTLPAATLFFLDIGPHGVGKTSKLGTLPKPLILDVEGGDAGTIPLRDKNIDAFMEVYWPEAEKVIL